MTDEVEGVRRWIEESGFALEMRAGRVAALHGFGVRQSMRYDAEAEQAREIDLLIGGVERLGPAEFAVLAAIECKRTDAAWVAMQSGPPPWGWKTTVLARPTSHAMRAALDRLGVGVALDPLFERPTTFAVKVAHTREGGSAKSRDVVYDGARQAIDAASAFSKGDAAHYGMVFPVVVTSASLFSVTMDASAEMDVRPAQRAAMAIRHGGELAVFHVVTEEGLSDFLRDLRTLTDSLRVLVTQWLES